VDALIAALDALIQKKQQIKKGAMQKLLSGNKRLPSFSGAWEEKSLKELLKKFQNGNAFSAKGYVDNGVAIVTMAQIGLKGGFKFNANKVNRWPYEDYDSLSNYHLKNGDLIISMTDVTPDKNLIGRMAIVESNEKTLLNQRVGLLVVDEEKVNPFLLKTLSNMKEWREYCKSVASLGVQANISTKAIKNAKITIPSIEEQNAIAQILSDMDAEIQSLEAKRNKYQQIKQGMMQELLTGKTRLVKETIENVEADIQSEPNHNWEIDEAVLISVLADRFGNKEFPLGRFRRTKFSYLVRRFLESKVDQFLKKAAGPYNPKTRYSGPENIALNNGYVKNWKKGNRYGFIADENISQAQSYFKDWYGEEAISWLDEGFRFKNNDDLELLTTVDKSIVELREEGKAVSLANIKNVIASHPEWKAKLERELFSDENIEGAIKESLKLFK
jgi:type I restriction enzyme S subunit